MNDPTPEQAEALDVARQLARAGVPIFLAEPFRRNGRWVPDGGAGGYSLPSGWQRVEADPRILDRWRTGVAVCAVMGHRLDLVDVDPRNGGTVDALNGTMPPVHAVAATPSGGWHAFVRTLGVASRNDVLPGIDVKAGTPDGTGRGFAFIAPTIRAPKGGGAPVAYRWQRPPDLDALDADDGTGSAALLELITATRTAPHTDGAFAAPQPIGASPWDDLAATIAANSRHDAVVKLAAALRGRGGWRAGDAAAYMREVVFPQLDQTRGGHPYTLDEFDAAVADVFARYPDGHAPRLVDPPPATSGPGRLPPPHEPEPLDLGPPPTPALEFITFADLAARVDAAGPRRWLIRGLWPAGDYGVYAAAHKVGKTWSADDLAVAVAAGKPWLGTIPVDQTGPVVMFVGEGGEANTVRRVRAIAEHHGISAEELPLVVCMRVPHLNNAEHLKLMGAKIAEIRPALVTLDPLYLAAHGANLRDLYEMGALLEGPQHMCQAVGASLFVNHHFNRQQGDGTSRIAGAGPAEWGRVLITAAVISSRTDPDTKATTVIAKLGFAGSEIPGQELRVTRRIVSDDPDDLDAPLHYDVTVESVDDTEGDDGTDRSPAAAKLLAALEAAGGEARTGAQLVDWIAEHHGHGLTRETVSRVMNELAQDDRVDSVDQGQFKPKLWLLRSPESPPESPPEQPPEQPPFPTPV